MNFYAINSIETDVGIKYDLTSNKEELIGLFKCKENNNHWSGTGNYCGWYSAEFYHNVDIIAAFIIRHDVEDGKLACHSYTDGEIIKKYIGINDHWDKIRIGSIYWEINFYADNDAQAIKKFFNEDYFETEQ